jgi:hypothetical protein
VSEALGRIPDDRGFDLGYSAVIAGDYDRAAAAYHDACACFDRGE